jgi:delta14-sterol reductase
MNDKKSFAYEFGGPIGALATTLSLPVVVLLLVNWSDAGRVDLRAFDVRCNWQSILRSPVFCPSCVENRELLFRCGICISLWFLFQVFLERMLPCEIVQGSPIQKTNNRLEYRINGHLAFWVTLLAVLCGWPYWNAEFETVQFAAFPIQLLYTYYAELAFVTILLCFALNTYLYLDSFVGRRVLADGGDSGNVFYDFFIGRELNPRIGSFDWKEFCELRPGLIGWMLLNMASLKQQQQELGYVTGSMMLVTIFQGMYVWDALYQERAILTTMDITTDGFGFMLLFGDLAWVPFTYSIQARYLVKHDPQWSVGALAAILVVHAFGYVIFRGANGQKDAFRRNPNDPALAHLTYLQTKRGTKLLTSGWWGMARKINYTGDWIMAVTWCAVCGVDSIVPYFYAIYFMILLIHRSMRDDHLCADKYGDDWTEYKKLVPYRFIPGIV